MLRAWPELHIPGALAEPRRPEAWAVHCSRAGQGQAGSLGTGPPGRTASDPQGMLLAAGGNVEACRSPLWCGWWWLSPLSRGG